LPLLGYLVLLTSSWVGVGILGRYRYSVFFRYF